MSSRESIGTSLTAQVVDELATLRLNAGRRWRTTRRHLRPVYGDPRRSSVRSTALVVAVVLAAPLRSAASPDLTPRFVRAAGPAPVALALDDAAQDARHRRRRNGAILVGLGVAAAALGTYAYWDANRRPGRPDDALYVGLGNLGARGLWIAGAAAIGWGTWLIVDGGADATSR